MLQTTLQTNMLKNFANITIGIITIIYNFLNIMKNIFQTLKNLHFAINLTFN